jgi:hypothetical protein
MTDEKRPISELLEQIKKAQEQKLIVAFYYMPKDLYEPSSNRHQAIFYINNQIPKENAFALFRHIRKTYPVIDACIARPSTTSDVYCISFVYFDPTDSV